MSKSFSSSMAESKKWLKKNGETGLNLKAAQAALANVEKVSDELGKTKIRLAELVAARKSGVQALAAAMATAKTEKRLKAKESRLQSKLAALAAPPANVKQ
jgi:hypothetical protein